MDQGQAVPLLDHQVGAGLAEPRVAVLVDALGDTHLVPLVALAEVGIDMTDQMRFDPAQITVKRGDIVRFVPVNKGQVLHEMVLGTIEADPDNAAKALDAGATHYGPSAGLPELRARGVTVIVNSWPGISSTHPEGYVVFVAGLVHSPLGVTVKSSAPSTVRSPSGATIGTGTGTGTIFNDDDPRYFINDVSTTEGNSGTVQTNLSVTLSAASTQYVIKASQTTAELRSCSP